MIIIIANDGGAIYAYYNSYMSFKGNLTAYFCSNNADYSGEISTEHSHVSFGDVSIVEFIINIAFKG